MTPIDQLSRTSKIETSEAKEMVPGDQTPTSEKMDEVSELKLSYEAPCASLELDRAGSHSFLLVLLERRVSGGFFFYSRQLEMS